GGEEQTYLATSTQLGGLNRWYYDWNIGGGFGLTTEATRRFIPKDPGFEYYNPFRTDMPSWLPGDEAGYFLNFKSAEIFNQIAEPWRRLPGDGFLAANPEWEEHG
ncbi:hypothetical protein LRR18_17490, partial [Mangrovimonas sp. AS39]|uniref:hypothetical protein n=1 Tax=Mangrovimonas futianensis TaxID=2895523 RepID=UPI001E5F81F9